MKGEKKKIKETMKDTDGNAAFQRRARQDKELSAKEKCSQIEVNNIMGRTRDLYRGIR